MQDRIMEMQPHGAELDSQSRRILDAIKGGDDWMNRRAIAEALGKKQLNPYDIAILQILTAQELIEIRRQDNNSPVGWEWQYKAKG